MKRIGMLGGTFDPPHIGHLLIADEVKHVLQLDEIWFIPTNEPPHKKQAVTSNENRMRMLELMIEKEPYFQINPIELRRKGKSYTIDTVNELRQLETNAQFYFIIGADMVMSLSTWKDIDDLLTKVQFVGVGRPGFVLETNYSIETVSFPLLEISSTDIRKRILEGKPFKYFLAHEVYVYIKEHGLYGYK